MKKTTRIAALLAAAALIFGGLFCSCSDSDDGVNTGAGGNGETTAGEPTDTGTGSGPSTPAAYTLDITSIPETTGSTSKIDDTVTVVSTIQNSSGKDQTIKYSSNGYCQMSGAKAQTGYGLQLTLTGAATITATATEKNDSTSGTKLVLLNSEGTAVSTSEASIDANGTAKESLKEISLSADAGTYIFGPSAGGCFLYSLVITYK
ncbi:MAG: hypothetical protein NC041_01060 [Bacteroides sp.]|nr:hypothetical protein [Prevotella sp.]MCM1408064.1 hypothetical protein [Treponema brennaborense]MCM1469040.1 hypothetical protein [Bacteroides sp.]